MPGGDGDGQKGPNDKAGKAASPFEGEKQVGDQDGKDSVQANGIIQNGQDETMFRYGLVVVTFCFLLGFGLQIPYFGFTSDRSIPHSYFIIYSRSVLPGSLCLFFSGGSLGSSACGVMVSEV